MKFYKNLCLAFFITMIFSNTALLGANGYTVVDIGVPSVYYDDVYPIDMNNAGQIIGWANPTDSAVPSNTRAYFVLTPEDGVWFKDENGDGGNDLMKLLAPLDSLSYTIININDSGHIVGQLSTNGIFLDASYVWKDGIFTILGAPGGIGLLASKPYSLNNVGQVVGYMKVDTFRAETESYIWNNGVPTNLSDNFLVGTEMFINDLGDVVIHRERSPGGGGQIPVIFQNGSEINIGDGDISNTVAYGLNENSQVVGIYRSDAFVWDNGILTSLDSETFFGYDINNNGEVVGSLRGNIGQRFLWLPEPAYGFPAGLKVMDATIPPPGRVDKLEEINDSGVILAAGRMSGNDIAAVFIPIPPPSITVNSVGDDIDNNPGDGICNTGNLTAGGDPECTMRAAIMESNALSENVIIDFNIPVDPTIQPNSALPHIEDTVYIDGYSQPGNLPVLIDGLNAGNLVDGLVLASDDVWVEGLFIGRFDGNGILLLVASKCKITGCTIGFSDSSDVNFGNGFSGISLLASSHNTIGAKETWEKNNISNNVLDGISITGISYNNRIVNNSIGKGFIGNDLGNGGNGVYIGELADTTIIGIDLTLNSIRGNNKNGIYIDGADECEVTSNELIENKENGILLDNASKYTYVLLNHIGTSLLGRQAGNLGNGIEINFLSDSNFIGATYGVANYIKNNGANGIKVQLSSFNTIEENFLTLNETNGIHLDSSSKFNRIISNKIGIDEDGFGRANKNFGISISSGSDSNFIGGTTDLSNQIANNLKGGMKIINSSYNQINGNEITFNAGPGILLDSSSQYNVLIRNKIGIDFDGFDGDNLDDGIQIYHNSDSNFIGLDNETGNTIMSNVLEGIDVRYSNYNMIRGNIISLNFGTGLLLDSMSHFNVVTKNKIGLDSSGAAAGNEKFGILINNSSDSNFIGGLKEDGNIISGNLNSGIFIDSSNYNFIQGNIIGLDSTGLIATGNKWDGIGIYQSHWTVIGVGVDADSNLTGTGNLISANDSSGVIIYNNSWYTWVTSNIIGRGIDTVVVRPNMWGISIYDSPNTFIGGEGLFNEYLGNYILDNNRTGIILSSNRSSVYGNYIWNNGFGGQGGDGIYIKGYSNFIGGDTITTYNSILNNNGIGIAIDNLSNTFDDFNNLRFNEISGNLLGGIDLSLNGPNLNDTLDIDGGPNAGQNSPQIQTATLTGSGQIEITGMLVSEPNQKYLIDFYGNTTCDLLGLGQGEYWIGCDTIQTDNFGFLTFYSVTNQIIGAPPNFITATANNFLNFNTSEFSNCNDVVIQSSGVDLFVDKTDNLDSAVVDTAIQYQITVTNIGSDDATNVIMRDSLPAQLTYISDSTTKGICTELDGVVQCNLGTLISGASATITILALTVDSGLTENSAIVSTNEVDIQLLNNSSTDTTIVVAKIPTDIGDEVNILPTKFDLAQNYPNPFNPSTEINFSLPTKSHVTIEVFNIVGQKIKTLLDTQSSAGFHSITWNGKNEFDQTVSSGIYLYRFTTDEFTSSKKMLLLK